MYNPLSLLSAPLLVAITKSPKLFVQEYYERGSNRKNDLPFLLTCYDKENNVEQSRAHFHLKQLGNAPFSCMYDSQIKEDIEKLLEAASQPSGYNIYINMLYVKWVAPKYLRNNIHMYMQHNLPWWNYSKTNQLHIHLKDRYGKLYLQLNWKANKAEVILEEIENFSVCATT